MCTSGVGRLQRVTTVTLWGRVLFATLTAIGTEADVAVRLTALKALSLSGQTIAQGAVVKVKGEVEERGSHDVSFQIPQP